MFAFIRNISQKQIFQNTLIFSGASILNRAIPFFLAPIITMYLSPADYGVVASFISLLGVLIVFSGVNSNGILAVKFFTLDRASFKLLVGNLMIILIASASVLFVVMWILSEWLSARFSLPITWIMIGLLAAMSMFITNVHLGLWQLEKKARNYAVYTILQTILNIGLSLFLIIVWQMKWEGRIVGIVISLLAFGLLSLLGLYFRGYMTFRYNKLLFTEALAFGLPLIPHNLSGWLRTGVSIVIISDLVDTATAGVYNLGTQFAMIVFFLGNGFTMALMPVIHEKLANINPAENLKLVRLNYLFFAVIIAVAVAVSVAAPLAIGWFFDERYHDAVPFIPLLSFSFAFFSMYLAVVSYLMHYKKTVALSIISTASGLINAGLCYWLVGAIGAIGAAQASLVSFAFMFFVVLFYANRVHPLPWLKFGAVLKMAK